MRRVFALVGVLGLLALIGCGGGGGGSETSRVAVLATDSLRDDYNQIWASVLKIELVASAGADMTLFTDPNGRLLDLRALGDSTGPLYSFLGEADVPAGSYTGVRVTLAPSLRLFPVGGGSPVLPTLAEGSNPLLLAFPSPRRFTSGDELVLDFDLARFVLSGDRLTPALAEGARERLLTAERHDYNDYHGLVSNLQGGVPERTFTLNRGNGQSVRVVTTRATAVFGAATFENGRVVEVEGRYNPATNRLVASAIEVKGSGEDAPSESAAFLQSMAHGAASALDTTAGTFTLTPHQLRGFALGQRTVKIVTLSTTEYHTDGGRVTTQAAFFTRLTTAPHVKLRGSYDPRTNTLTAQHARLSDHSNDGGWEAEIHYDGDDRNRDGVVNSDDDSATGTGGGHNH